MEDGGNLPTAFQGERETFCMLFAARAVYVLVVTVLRVGKIAVATQIVLVQNRSTEAYINLDTVPEGFRAL